jgi:hypothetical protein
VYRKLLKGDISMKTTPNSTRVKLLCYGHDWYKEYIEGVKISITEKEAMKLLALHTPIKTFERENNYVR